MRGHIKKFREHFAKVIYLELDPQIGNEMKRLEAVRYAAGGRGITFEGMVQHLAGGGTVPITKLTVAEFLKGLLRT